jgi:hypothetical protein
MPIAMCRILVSVCRTNGVSTFEKTSQRVTWIN